MLRKEEESQQREWHTKAWSWENPAGLRAGGTGAKASPRVGVGVVLAKEVLVGGGSHGPRGRGSGLVSY